MTTLGIDHTGTWTPSQYAIDAGWDFTCIQATAEKGVSSADAEGLTETQQAELLDFCKSRSVDALVAEIRSFATDDAQDISQGIFEDAVSLADCLDSGEITGIYASQQLAELRDRLNEASTEE